MILDWRTHRGQNLSSQGVHLGVDYELRQETLREIDQERARRIECYAAHVQEHGRIGLDFAAALDEGKRLLDGGVEVEARVACERCRVAPRYYGRYCGRCCGVVRLEQGFVTEDGITCEGCGKQGSKTSLRNWLQGERIVCRGCQREERRAA